MPEPTPHTQPLSAAALDPASLERLHELDPDGRNHVVERVLHAFDASLQRLLPLGESAFEQHDHEALRHVVHTLKSSSASVGALDLSQRCGEIENRLRIQRDEDVGPLWAGLQHEGRRVQLAVQALLVP